MTVTVESTDILVIGAGPSGSMAASLLHQAGMEVLVIEKEMFPRFSIGESLLPQSMAYLEQSNMLSAVEKAGFQFKNGAAFCRGEDYSDFDFRKKFSEGPGTTFQVRRADFDKLLADTATEQGVCIRYQHQLLGVEKIDSAVVATIQNEHGENYQIQANFILDASGFGRVLPRLMDLELPSTFPSRQSVFCHVKDNIQDVEYDRNKILISVHPEQQDVWYWLIPFSDGTSSLGVVAKPEYFENINGSAEEKLWRCVADMPKLNSFLSESKAITQVKSITGYSANVKSLFGEHFALLGNAGEFLDPVFSSGVTIAFKSAALATDVLIRERNGDAVCWQNDYANPLMQGVDTFRAFVEAWYDGRLQDIIFFENATNEVREMVCSILAGYAWDESNPFVAKTERRLNVLAEICKAPSSAN